MDETPDASINPPETEPEGRARGGHARARNLTPEERQQIARKAAESRWHLPLATHVGEIQIGDSQPLPCAVLADGRRVLSERGVGKALGKGFGGKDFGPADDGAGRLPFFLAAKNLQPFISSELRALVTQPILYRDPRRGGKPAHGIEATVLPQVCDVWLKARDAGEKVLKPSQRPIAIRADILMRGLAHTGIIALVDEATGYQEVRDRKALQEILDRFIGKELAKWVKTFPDEFYEQIFRLKHWEFNPSSSKRPMLMARLTADLVYDRLAPGVLQELREKSPKDEKGRRKNKLFQWLTADIGHPKLKELLTGLIYLGKGSKEWFQFYDMVERAMPRYGTTMRLPFDDDSTSPSALSPLSEQ
jgi:hypothetical protein